MHTKFALPSRPAAVVSLLLAFLLFSSLSSFSQVVISQVYGGGGNSGAPLHNDYIELFNRGTAPVSLAGMSVQYGSTTGNLGSSSSLVTALPATMLQPGQYFLVAEASGGTAGAPLPSADASGGINLSATGGKVALVNGTTALGCGATATPCTGASLAQIVDLVGFGSATWFETAPAPAGANGLSVLRKGNGCTDTDNNSADFVSGAPAPRNSSNSTSACSGLTATGGSSPAKIESGDLVLLTVSVGLATNPTSTGVSVTADLSAIGGSSTQPLYDDGATGGDAVAGDNVFSYQLPISGTPGALTFPVTARDAQSRSASSTATVSIITPVPAENHLAIHAIQGPGDASPYAGVRIATEGIVTLRKSNGFFIQAPESEYDGDPNTSEGLFVFTSSAPPATAQVGNRVKVVGTMQEYSPSGDPLSPPLTEVGNFELANVISTGNPLPAPIALTAADVMPTNSYNTLEKYEGMRVHVDSLSVTGPTEGKIDEPIATSSSYGTFDGVITGYARPFREAGIEDPDPIPTPPYGIPRFDANPERLRVDTSYLTGGKLEVATGAVVTNLTGPLDYQYRTYMIDAEPASGAAIALAGMAPQAARAADATEFTVATMNLARFYDTTDDPLTSDVVLSSAAFANRLNKVSLAVRDVLHLPDVIGVEEMENIGALTSLANNISAVSGATYSPYLIEGNDIGGIDVGFLVKSTVAVSDVQQYGKTDNYYHPGTSDPYIVSGHPDVLNDRPPLVISASIQANGQTLPFCVIANHLRSLSGVDDPADDRVRQKRLQEAQFLANLVASLQSSGSPQACGGNVISVGDYNAYEVNDGYVDVMGTLLGTADPNADMASGTLTPTGLSDLVFLLPASARYSYVYDGTAQVLDHVLVNTPMGKRVTDFTYVHNNADFPESARNNFASPVRYSDHDIGLAYFALPVAPPVLHLPADMTVEATSAAGAVVTFTVTADSNGTPTAVTCDKSSGATFPMGATTVSCSSADARGNTATGSFSVTVQDTTPPVVTVTGVANGAIYPLGNVPQAACSASDAASGVAVQPTLAISGGNSYGAGSFTATCSGAQDGAGNLAAPVSVTYTVAYNFSGFLPPFGNQAVKSGSTVPLKWFLTDGSGAIIGNLSSVTGVKYAPSNCVTIGSPSRNANFTGGTALRFDPTTGQFIVNWSTSGLTAGCYGVQVSFDDGTTRGGIVTIR